VMPAYLASMKCVGRSTASLTMQLSAALAKFPFDSRLAQFEPNFDRHDSTAASTMRGKISHKDGITLENTVQVTPALNSKGMPQHTQSWNEPLWTRASNYFEAIFFDEIDNQDCLEEEDSECSEDLVDDVEIIVGPSEYAAKPYDLQQLRLWCVRTEKWAPIRSTQSILYFTDIIRLSQAQTPTRSLSFGSMLHMNGSIECRPCTFDRPRKQCMKKWLCDFCHMHIGAEHLGCQPKHADSRRIQMPIGMDTQGVKARHQCAFKL